MRSISTTGGRGTADLPRPPGWRNTLRKYLSCGLEARVVHELLEQLGVVAHHGGHHAQQRLVVLDARVLPVRGALDVAEGGVLPHPVGDGLDDELPHAVGVLPPDVAEVFVLAREGDQRPVAALALGQVVADGVVVLDRAWP